MPDQIEMRPVRPGAGEEQIARTVASNAMMLRTILERLDELIQLLTPKPSDGPTLDELLARVVTLIADQAITLNHINDGLTLLLESAGTAGKSTER